MPSETGSIHELLKALVWLSALNTPSPAAALAFSKQAAPEADALIGRSILFNWGSIGWHLGVLQRRIYDGRTKRSGEQCNFYIYYEVDDEEVPTALRLEEYGVDEECGWVLLEALPADGVHGDEAAGEV